MQTDSTTTPKLSFEASCSCGAASWRLEGEPLLSVYCHCTKCQRRSGAPVVHGIHYSTTSFSWTHENPDAVFSFQALSHNSTVPWTAYFCQTCYTSIGASHPVMKSWALKAGHLKRDPATNHIKDFDKIKPTGHIFYGTRVVDIPDGLPKWDGFENKSNRLDLP